MTDTKIIVEGTVSRRDFGDTIHETCVLYIKYSLVVWFWQDHLGPWLWTLLKIYAGKDGAI